MIIIIGGFPRSGTRSYTDILNLVDNVDIRGEIHRAALPPLANWLQLNDTAHADIGLKDEYKKHRWLTGLNAIVGTGRGKNTPFTQEQIVNDIIGFKCPSIEIRYKYIEKIFKNKFNPIDKNDFKIQFFFCVRSLDQVYLSRANMSMNKRGKELPISSFIAEVINQINSFKMISKSVLFQSHVLFLDDFICSKDKFSWVLENIFNKLNIPEEVVLKLYDENFKNTNSTLNVFGKHRKTELTIDEKNEIAGNSELLSLCRSFNDSYYVDLLNFI